MAPGDSIWIDLRTRLHEVLLQEHHRPYSLFEENRLPSAIDPHMIMFIGDRNKTLSMNSLFSIQGREDHKKIHLWRVPEVGENQSPAFIADCELHNILSFRKAIAKSVPGVIDQRSLRWHQQVPGAFYPKILTSLVYMRLISPFCNVICFFVDDLGGTRETAKILASWLTSQGSRSSDLPRTTHPRALILKRWTDPCSVFDEKLATIDFMLELRNETDRWYMGRRAEARLSESKFHELLMAKFSHLRVLNLPAETERHYETSLRSLALRDRIFQESQDMQNLRRSTNVAFSMRHFKAFLHSAVDHFAKDALTPFSFIEASRGPNPVPPDIATHLSNFIRRSPPKTLLTHTARLVASALSLDSYPPDMHSFDPLQMFRITYDNVFREVQNKLRPQDPKLFYRLRTIIEKEFCHQVSRSLDQLSDLVTSHKAILSEFPYWRRMYSNTICLSCVIRCPEHTMSCNHSLCDSCVVMHGRTNPDEPWRFILENCPMCKVPNRTIFPLKPYTAGTRCLSILSGSPQELLKLAELEKDLKLCMPIRNYFDVGIGSGFGAIFTLQLFCSGQSIENCLNLSQMKENGPSRFSQDSTILGGSGRLTQIPFVKSANRWRGTMNSKSSSSYSIQDLKDLFGKEKTLFECSENGTKVAVIVPRFRDSRVDIHSNYNGTGERLEEHSMIRAENFKDEILLWQVGQIITSDSMKSRGFDAGDGMAYVDLINLTVREQSNIWSRGKRDPDVLLCFGEKPPGNREKAKLLSSLFYVELLGAPMIADVGFMCRAQLRCRLLPSQSGFSHLIERLQKVRARFYYDHQSVPCVNQQLLEEARRGLPFSRYIEFATMSLCDNIDIKIDGLYKTPLSISNCPYMLHTLIRDQGLNCVFGHKDQQRRFLGL